MTSSTTTTTSTTELKHVYCIRGLNNPLDQFWFKPLVEVYVYDHETEHFVVVKQRKGTIRLRAEEVFYSRDAVRERLGQVLKDRITAAQQRLAALLMHKEVPVHPIPPAIPEVDSADNIKLF